MPIECPICGDSFHSDRAMHIHRTKSHDDSEIHRSQGFTGIEGFDQLMDSGVPKGSSILVEGGPGSGKTIFCLQIAKNAVRKGDKVLYMSFEESVGNLISHMKEFGWAVDEDLKNNNLKIKEYNSLEIARSVEALLSEAKRELLIDVKPMLLPEDYEPDIVIIDSLTSIASAFSGENSRFRVYMEQLFDYLEDEEISSYLIREARQPSQRVTGSGVRGEAVSFLSDGIITMYNTMTSEGTRKRGIEIFKMRGENFESGIYRMDITEVGITIHPDENVSRDMT